MITGALIKTVAPYLIGAVLMGGVGFAHSIWVNGKIDKAVEANDMEWRAKTATQAARLAKADSELVKLRAAALLNIQPVLDAVARVDADSLSRARHAERELRNLRKDYDALEADTSLCAATPLPDDRLRLHQQNLDFLDGFRDDSPVDPGGGD